MADQHGRKSQLVLVLGNHAQDGVAADGVLSGGGLVEQDDFRIGHQGPGQGHPFLHAPGQLCGVFVGDLHQFGLSNALEDTGVDVAAAQPGGVTQRHRDVLVDGQAVEQSVVLKHVADTAESGFAVRFAHGVDRLSVQQDFAGIGLEQADDVF